MSEKSPILVSVQFDGNRTGENLSNSLNRSVIDWTKADKPTSLAGVKYALVWKIDPDLFDRMPDLEVIFSAGAGVDKIMEATHLPDVPIVRFVDDTLTNRMSEWVCLQCLMHLRQQRTYDQLQDNREWKELPQPQASEINVGIMGLGVLGQDAARKLKMLGFGVRGWSRTKKSIEGLTCFDQNETDAFLEETDFLVGLLPLTPDTESFFDRSVFQKLRKHADLKSPVFINAGRGRSQNEKDVLACLQDGTLGGASLDVFQTEPLPKDSELWNVAGLIITPHAAATSDISALGRHVEKQIARHEAGEMLENVVDRKLGY